MDPFRMCLAFGPVAVYLLLLGAVNLSRRPFLVTGGRDAAALGLAVSGLIVVGPLELFFIRAAAPRFGPYVWLMLILLYALGLVLVLLVLRPRLIVYNMSLEELRPILAGLVPQLDAEARWAGDGLYLPNLGVQLHVDAMPALRNVSLAAVGAGQDYLGWRRLERALADALANHEVGRNPRGISLVTAGLFISAWLVIAIARNPEAVSQALFDMLRL